MNTKPAYLSKTMWLNFLGGLAAALGIFFPQVLPLGSWISAHGMEIGLGWSILNMLLRAVTKDKVVLSD